VDAAAAAADDDDDDDVCILLDAVVFSFSLLLVFSSLRCFYWPSVYVKCEP